MSQIFRAAAGPYTTAWQARETTKLPVSYGESDVYAGSVAPCIFPKPGFRRDESIPDVRAMLARGLRYVDLNEAITTCYTQMGPMFERIVDPAGNRGTPPNWYAIAAFASRSAGQGMLAARSALSVLDANGPKDTATQLRRACPQLSKEEARALQYVIDATFLGQQQRRIATFLVALAVGMQGPAGERWTPLPNAGLLDPRILTISVARLVHIVHHAPGGSLADKLSRVATTVANGLEDGNRRIVSDIGVAGQAFLEFRRARANNVTPDDILDAFSPSGVANPPQAHALYDFATAACQGDGPLPADFEQRFPAPAWDSNNMLVAGFALYEQAGRTADPASKARLIAFANNYLAYREQHDAAQPAFTPGQTLDGEVDRVPVWRLLSPAVDIKARFGTWTYTRYAANHLPPRDHNPLTPRVTEYNWGTFDDRWNAILDAFDTTYAHADAMWPMPDPDPARGIDAPAGETGSRRNHAPIIE